MKARKFVWRRGGGNYLDNSGIQRVNKIFTSCKVLVPIRGFVRIFQEIIKIETGFIFVLRGYVLNFVEKNRDSKGEEKRLFPLPYRICVFHQKNWVWRLAFWELKYIHLGRFGKKLFHGYVLFTPFNTLLKNIKLANFDKLSLQLLFFVKNQNHFFFFEI